MRRRMPMMCGARAADHAAPSYIPDVIESRLTVSSDLLPAHTTPFEISEAGAAADRSLALRGIGLGGELGISAAKALASISRSAAVDAPQAATGLLRLVVSDPVLQKGLADGTMRFATPTSGDASVLIKHVANGRFAGRADLVNVGPTGPSPAVPAAGLGSAIAVGAAIAVISYQLQVLDAKLDVVGRDVKRVIEHLELEHQGHLAELRDTAWRVADTLDDGGTVSDALAHELADELRSTRPVWRQLYDRAASDVAKYRAGAKDVDHRSVLVSWERLLIATQVLGEAVQALIRLPQASPEQWDLVIAEQQQRLADRLEDVRRLAGDLYAAHLHWRAETAEYELSLSLNPAKLAKRAVAKRGDLRRPPQKILDERAAWECAQLAAPPAPPEALLVGVGDGRLEIAVEAHEMSLAA